MESDPPQTQSLPAGTRLEEFVIERVLGSGGFGITYFARDTRLDRQVVIKENLPAQFCFRDTHSLTVAPRHTHGEDAENFRWSLENFSKEAAMLASLDNAGIVRVHRSFEAFGTAYFVMPYLEGLTFDELIASRRDKGQEFSEDELRGFLFHVLGALGYLHDRGVYHRDLKPGNLFITIQGMPVLIDFGSARQRLSERSMTVIESAGYTPFEQLQSRGNVGPWSDLYALAATLVKVMTGEAPPKANDRTMGDPWRPLCGRTEMAGRYSQVFLACLDRALMLRVEDRWQSAEEWLRALSGRGVKVPAPLVPGPPSIPPPCPLVPAIGSVTETVLLLESEKKAAILRNSRTVAAVAAGCIAFLLLAITVVITSNDSERVTDSARVASKVPEQMVGSEAGEERDFEIAPGVKMTMRWIPPGEFMMGSPEGEMGRQDDEVQHRVRITKGFWLGKYEVTQAQWRAVMGTNPSYSDEEDLPVEKVSWNDIASSDGFIERVNQAAAAGGGFSLPTEAQWEYAARVGATTALNSGKELTSIVGPCRNLDEVGWYDQNSGKRTHGVGQKKPNGWGLHDMHGNVWEWCQDWYGPYESGLGVDPQGTVAGSDRVLRGGSWSDFGAINCRVANRSSNAPTSADSHFGFRVARSSVP